MCAYNYPQFFVCYQNYLYITISQTQDFEFVISLILTLQDIFRYLRLAWSHPKSGFNLFKWNCFEEHISG